MVSPRGGVFEGEKYLLQAESLLSQLESQKQSTQIKEKVVEHTIHTARLIRYN